MTGLLIDTDAFLLLSGGQLIDQAISLIGVAPEETYRLDPLPHMIGRSAGIRERYSAEARDRARVASERFRGIGRRPPDDLFQRLVEVEDIDEGEALLFGIAADERNYLLVSGDKRAMIAVCSDPALADICEAVCGRVLCIESVLRRLVRANGIERVSTAFRDVAPAHRTLQVLFSPGCCASDEAFLEAADSYIGDLKGRVSRGFLREL